MLPAQPLDCIPLWVLGFMIVGGVSLAMELGYWLGRFRGRCSEHEKESSVGTAVAATLGLAGFVLAFTFSMAGSRFEDRRQALLDEANAIGTTYLRAGTLPEDRGQTIRPLLREYVDVRLEAVRTGDFEAGIRRSEQLHAQIWAEAQQIAKKQPESIQLGLFVQSLNQTIDLHTTRVVAGYSRIPLAVWVALYSLTALSMVGAGYHSGLTSKARSLSFGFLAITFSVVMLLVADLDRPGEGLLRVSQKALVDLRSTMDNADL
jgi:hypothetical protein